TKMRSLPIAFIVILICSLARTAEIQTLIREEKKLNNLVSVLLEVSSISKASKPLPFTPSNAGWVVISARCEGKGTVRLTLDRESNAVMNQGGAAYAEAMRRVTQGTHTIQVECEGGIRVDRLLVKAIPELIHCGLGFNQEIKSYGVYDMEFLKADVLPNVTTLIVPPNIELSESVIEDWHRQGKRFVAEVGIDSQARTAEEHFKYC